MRDKWANVGRHKVICRVIDWTAMPDCASSELAEKLRAERQSRVTRASAKPRVGIRYQVPSAGMPQKNWDYSISIG